MVWHTAKYNWNRREKNWQTRIIYSWWIYLYNSKCETPLEGRLLKINLKAISKGLTVESTNILLWDDGKIRWKAAWMRIYGSDETSCDIYDTRSAGPLIKVWCALKNCWIKQAREVLIKLFLWNTTVKRPCFQFSTLFLCDLPQILNMYSRKKLYY